MEGDDFINSGRGFDTIITGSGSDTILLRPEQASYTIETTKTIVDFVKGEDRLALEGISFEEISINQGTMDFSSHVILSATDTSGVISYLGVLENLNASDLDINDFIENPFAKKELTTSIEKWVKWVIMARRSCYEASPYGYS